jgi:hypothetical protein
MRGSYAIDFDPSLFGQAQTIALGAPLALTCGADVTIAGPGADLLTIDCSLSGAACTVASGATLGLDGVTIAGAKTSAIVNGGTLNVTSCTFLA